MSPIEQQQQNIQKYYAIKEQINSIVSDLNGAIENIGGLEHDLGSVFRVNDENPAITNRIAGLRKRIADVVGYLGGTVSPNLDTSVNFAKNRIVELEEEERRREEELRRQEENRRREAEAMQREAEARRRENELKQQNSANRQQTNVKQNDGTVKRNDYLYKYR